MIQIAENADSQVVVEMVAEIAQFARDMEEAANKMGVTFGRGADQVGDAMDRAKSHTENFANEAGKHGERAGNSFMQGFTLIIAAGAADFLNTLRETIDKASEYASRLSTLAAVTGNSTTDLQKFEFAMRSVGVSSEQAQQQLTIFQRRIVESAAKANDTSSSFHRMGLSVKDMVGNRAIQNFEIVAQKIAAIKNPAEQTTAAMDTFGSRLGARLLPLLEKGVVGIDALMAAASGMGAIMPPELIKNLEDFDHAMKELQQSTQAFFAILAGPVIPALTALNNGLMRFMSMIEHMDAIQRLQLLIVSVTASFLVFELGIEALGGFFGGLIPRELLNGLKTMGGYLQVLALIVGVVALAWTTNFANIHEAITSVVTVLRDEWNPFVKALQDSGNIIRANVGPAFAELSKAVAPLLQNLADLAKNAIKSGDGFNWMRKAAADLSLVIKSLVEDVTFLTKNFDGLVKILFSVAAGMFTFQLIAAWPVLMAAASTAVGVLAASLVDLGVASLAAKDALVSGGLIKAVIAFTESLWGAAAAEAVATFGISALVVGLVLLALNFKTVTEWLDKLELKIDIELAKALASAKEGFATFVQWLDNTATAMQTQYPLLGLLIGLLDKAAGAAHRAAVAQREYANALATDWSNAPGWGFDPKNKPTFKTQTKDVTDALGYTTAPEETPKTGSYSPPDTKKKNNSGEISREELDKIKVSVDAAKQKFLEAENAVKKLDTAISNLGDINGPAKLAEGQEEYRKKIAATIIEIRAQEGVVRALAAAEAHTQTLASHTKDTHTQRTYRDASMTYHNERLTAQGKEDSLRAEPHKVEHAMIQQSIDYNKTLASDQLLSYEQQNKANEVVLAGLIKQQATMAAIHAQQLLIIKGRKDEADAILAGANQGRDADIENITNRTAARNATVQGPDPSGRATQVRALATAQDTRAIKEIEYAKAMDASRVANDNQAGMFDKTTQEYAAAAAATDTAKLNEKKASNAVTDAKQAEANIIAQTSVATNDVRTGLLGIAQKAAPEVVGVFQSIAAGVNPVVAIFLQLFEKSRSFHDIVVILQRVIAAIVPIFDALRPVLDFFLGVIAGVVNVFLSLYNVMITILNVFGAHLQKLRLVNTTLDDMGATGTKLVKAMTIVHDLPTMNEYNQGKWSDLVANQTVANNYSASINDVLDTGFSSSLAKFGQMIGLLIGIHTVLAIIQGIELANSLSSSGGNGGGGGGGIMGFIKGLFGHKSSNDPSKVVVTNTSGAPYTNAQGMPVASATNDPALALYDGGGMYPGANGTTEFTGAPAGIQNELMPTTYAGNANPGSLGKDMGVISGIMGVIGGFKQGGVAGGAEAGLGSLGITSSLFTGGAAAGPAGLIIAGAIAVGASLMHHDDPNKMPDKYNTQEYGSGVADLMGFAGANGQNFTESADTKNKLGGLNELDYINAHLDVLRKSDPNLANEFAGAKSVTSLHDGTLGLNNGTQKRWNDLLNDANSAVTKIFSNINSQAQAASELTSLLANSTSVDLAKMFGNGSVVTSAGGYSVTSGSGGGTTGNTRTATDNSTVQVNVNIGNLNGGDPANLTATLTPIMTSAVQDITRLQQRVIANDRFVTRQEAI